jgi:hypothetical protein
VNGMQDPFEALSAAPVPAVSNVVLGTWADRVQAEYATGAAASQLVLWLMQIGAAPELIVAGLRVVEEEVDHAARSFEICRLAGLSTPRPIPREALGLPRDPCAPLEQDIARGCLRVFCVGETYAVEMLREMRQVCAFAPASAVIDRLLADEVNHRRFGFEVIEWLLLTVGERDGLVAFIQAELSRIVADLRATFGAVGGPTVGALEQVWGVVPRPTYAAVLERVVASILPRHFAAIGVPVDLPAGAAA